MKLKAELNSETHDVEIHEQNGRLRARVEDRSYDIDVSEPEPGVFLLKSGGRVNEASVSNGSALVVQISGVDHEILITDPKRLRGSASGSDDSTGKAEIKTAMPGKVVRILKKTGDAVTSGDGVIVVEAMKMQNEMKSPKDGIVKDLRVSEGDTVSAGDVLVVIE